MDTDTPHPLPPMYWCTLLHWRVVPGGIQVPGKYLQAPTGYMNVDQVPKFFCQIQLSRYWHTTHCPPYTTVNYISLTPSTLGILTKSWWYFYWIHVTWAEYSGGYQLRAGPISINTQCLKYCPPPSLCHTAPDSLVDNFLKRFCKNWVGPNFQYTLWSKYFFLSFMHHTV